MDQNEIAHDPHLLGDPPVASKMIFEPMACLVQTVHLSCVKISTISKRTESSFHLTLVTLEYYLVHLKWFLSLGTLDANRAPIFALPLTLSQNRSNRESTWPTSPRRSTSCVENNFRAYSTFGASSAPVLHHDYHYLQMDWIKFSLEPRHLGIPSGVSKTISELMVRLAQTGHLSCIDTNTISKRTEMRFHMTHVT
jgi:hypothetical protein